MPTRLVQSLTTMADNFMDNVVNSQKAIIKNLETNDEIKVQFNPEEYSLDEATDYSVIPRRKSDSPVLNFAGGKTSKLKMTLYFNTFHVKAASVDVFYEEEDVSEQVQKVANLCKIHGETHGPPRVKFIWGSLSFEGVVNNVTSTYTMFARTGKPVRAKVDITFLGLPVFDNTRRSPFESPDRTKIRILSEDESLWNMAWKEYGDVSKWRHIAQANEIMDPLEIPVGTVLKVPAI
jgi:hypothetical protein